MTRDKKTGRKIVSGLFGLLVHQNYSNAGPARNPILRILHLSWDSPRHSHFDVPKLVLAREKSMYLELVPSEGQSQCRATIPAFISNFLVVYYSIS